MPNGPTPEQIPEPVGDPPPLKPEPKPDPKPVQEPQATRPNLEPLPGDISDSKKTENPAKDALDPDRAPLKGPE